MTNHENKNLVKILKEGGIAVMPTDTLYGIVGKAENKEVVERIYEARKRDPQKPCIILIGDTSELEKFSIVLSDKQKKEIKKYWPGPVSIILDCENERFTYLHRGTKTLAFRLPLPKSLRDLLKETGPLVAPSANIEGMPPAHSIDEAKKYFGNMVDMYLDGVTMEGRASKVIKLHKDGSVLVLRQ